MLSKLAMGLTFSAAIVVAVDFLKGSFRHKQSIGQESSSVDQLFIRKFWYLAGLVRYV